MTTAVSIERVVSAIDGECRELISRHNDVDFSAEQNYAVQLLYANDWALKIACDNPVSVQNALRNASAIGISLNPASKHAYLVPRKAGKNGYGICLDISYMGLMHLAMSTGSIEFGQAKLVYANDNYINTGIDKPPTHEYKAFGDRGDIVGAYCVVRTSTGAYLTEEMSIQQIHDIRARSESFKKNAGPWVSDHDEMCRKTVVKRASKYWPKVDRLNSAIEYLNTEGDEGIQMKGDQNQPKDITPATTTIKQQIIDGCAAKNKDVNKLVEFVATSFKTQINSLEEMTQQQAEWAMKALEKAK